MSRASVTTTEETTTVQKGFVGQNVPRREDRRLVQGQGVYFDDVKRHGMGYLHFLRSPYAHARIASIDVSAGGIRMKAHASARTGIAVRLTFTPPDGGPTMTTMGLLVRIDVGGYAFSFVNLTPSEARRLHDLRQETLISPELGPAFMSRIGLWQRADEIVRRPSVLRGRVTV